MPRIRYLKPEFFKDEDVAALTLEARLCYQGLWILADKAGRLEDRPLRLKVEIFPYDGIDIEKCLKQLSKVKPHSGLPFILRYKVEGQKYIQIINWDKHQKPHHTEKDSEIPPHPPMEKGSLKGMGNLNLKQLEASAELSNGEVTVKGYKSKGRKVFRPPTPIEVGEYAESIDFTLDGSVFCDYYESQGWKKNNGQPVKDWKACVRTWKHRDKGAGTSNKEWMEKE